VIFYESSLAKDPSSSSSPAVNALRRAIAEVKQHWSVIEWVTKHFLSRAPPCFGRHVKLLVPAAGSPYVQSIGKAMCLSSGDINKLMMMMINESFFLRIVFILTVVKFLKYSPLQNSFTPEVVVLQLMWQAHCHYSVLIR
jgi:hypothetical protein